MKNTFFGITFPNSFELVHRLFFKNTSHGRLESRNVNYTMVFLEKREKTICEEQRAGQQIGGRKDLKSGGQALLHGLLMKQDLLVILKKICGGQFPPCPASLTGSADGASSSCLKVPCLILEGSLSLFHGQYFLFIFHDA